MFIKATQKDMAKYTLKELIDFTEKMQDKAEALTPRLQRTTGMDKWYRNSLPVLCGEIQKRQLTAKDRGEIYPVFS
jgi:hypothetical protein